MSWIHIRSRCTLGSSLHAGITVNSRTETISFPLSCERRAQTVVFEQKTFCKEHLKESLPRRGNGMSFGKRPGPTLRLHPPRDVLVPEAVGWGRLLGTSRGHAQAWCRLLNPSAGTQRLPVQAPPGNDLRGPPASPSKCEPAFLHRAGERGERRGLHSHGLSPKLAELRSRTESEQQHSGHGPERVLRTGAGKVSGTPRSLTKVKEDWKYDGQTETSYSVKTVYVLFLSSRESSHHRLINSACHIKACNIFPCPPGATLTRHGQWGSYAQPTFKSVVLSHARGKGKPPVHFTRQEKKQELMVTINGAILGRPVSRNHVWLHKWAGLCCGGRERWGVPYNIYYKMSRSYVFSCVYLRN